VTEPDRTEQVLNHIDEALDGALYGDTSLDAMRWTPPREDDDGAAGYHPGIDYLRERLTEGLNARLWSEGGGNGLPADWPDPHAEWVTNPISLPAPSRNDLVPHPVDAEALGRAMTRVMSGVREAMAELGRATVAAARALDGLIARLEADRVQYRHGRNLPRDYLAPGSGHQTPPMWAAPPGLTRGQVAGRVAAEGHAARRSPRSGPRR